MPTYATPDPIAVTVDLPVGGLRVVASERADTVVEIHCSPGDRAYADGVTIDLAAGELRVTGPKLGLRTLLVPTPGRSLEVEIALPAGSSLSARTVYGAVVVEGHLDHCRVQVSYGDVRVGDAAAVELATSYGQVHAGDVAGDATITADHGDVRVDRVGGSATVRSRHGAVRLGEVVGETHLSGSHGDLDVDHALGSVAARTAHGTVRLGRVVRGEVSLTSTHGRLEVGVDPGSAVWLDADTAGRVRNTLTPREGPDGFGESVSILARSRDGDVVVRRS
ncbi:DUF4097 family beta strand repeat-containing protein [Actinomycetospora sp. NBC_00405]|uniref:DUF4097 family beta strand repeat-containing protein n=1 Tax=Actinomycetospora sp. NBC_00405 TaxID=2975952 RepID=UPI002E239D0C